MGYDREGNDDSSASVLGRVQRLLGSGDAVKAGRIQKLFVAAAEETQANGRFSALWVLSERGNRHITLDDITRVFSPDHPVWKSVSRDGLLGLAAEAFLTDEKRRGQYAALVREIFPTPSSCGLTDAEAVIAFPPRSGRSVFEGQEELVKLLAEAFS